MDFRRDSHPMAVMVGIVGALSSIQKKFMIFHLTKANGLPLRGYWRSYLPWLQWLINIPWVNHLFIQKMSYLTVKTFTYAFFHTLWRLQLK